MLIRDIQEKTAQFILNSPLNNVKELNNLQIWDQPLVGVASANDSLWERLKAQDAVGPQHLLPQELLQGAVSVISYFLPFTAQIRRSNCTNYLPSTEWLYGRYEGELLNDSIRQFIVSLIEGMGGRALAPALDRRFAVVNMRSNWSERHAAFVAGLGTFSLSRSMITRLGSAGRFGSVIVDIELQPTVREYQKIDEYCVKCGACIDRCPPRAISKAGKDNDVCSHYVEETKLKYSPRYGCGKCQTAVPCEGRNPRRI